MNLCQPETNPIKLFKAVIYGSLLQARVFAPAKPFQPSLMFAGETGAYPSEAPFRCSTLAAKSFIGLAPRGINKDLIVRARRS